MFFSSSLNPQAGAREDDLPWWPLAARDDVLLGSPKERQEGLKQARTEQQDSWQEQEQEQKQEQQEQEQEQEQQEQGGPSYSHWPALAL